MPEIIFKYKWLWGGYAADVTFTKDMINPEAWKYLADATRSLVTGSYTKHYTGRTTYEIINAILKDKKNAEDEFNKHHNDASQKATETSKGRTIDTKVLEAAADEDRKKILAFMLTKFCGYKKQGLFSKSLQPSTEKDGLFGKKTKLIIKEREDICNILHTSYKKKPYTYPDEAISQAIEGKEKLQDAYKEIYGKGEETNWTSSSGGTRRLRKSGQRYTRKNSSSH